VAIVAVECNKTNTHTYFDLTYFVSITSRNKKPAYFNYYIVTLEKVEVEMDEEELFFSQVWEKLCSPDCSSLVLKLFNMLSNEKQVESAVLDDATINATVLPQAHVDVMVDKGNFKKIWRKERIVPLTCHSKNSLSNPHIGLQGKGMQKNTKNYLLWQTNWLTRTICCMIARFVTT